MRDELHLHYDSAAQVAVRLPAAGLGNRALAYLVDLGIVGTVWLALALVVTALSDGWLDQLLGLGGMGQAALVVAALALTTGYDIVFELLWDGQTPGKRLLGLRVLRLDGGRVGLAESAARNVLRLVDLLPAGYGVGILCMALNRQQRRLGDLVSGCTVTREHAIDLDALSGPSAGMQVQVEAAMLQRARLVRVEVDAFTLLADFLARRELLIPEARLRVSRALAASFRVEVLGDDDAPGELPGARAEQVVAAVLQASPGRDPS
ncbi:MAG: RDD family protein [Pseudomonadota bacterium]